MSENHILLNPFFKVDHGRHSLESKLYVSDSGEKEGDMSSMNGTNLTMAGVCPLNSTFSIDNVSISLSVPKLGNLSH